jgi:hypothetical protein
MDKDREFCGKKSSICRITSFFTQLTCNFLALPWESDDSMGHTISDEDGNFVIEGCADDLGSWNDPDPYLIIEHRCPEPGHTVSIPRRRKM